MFEFIGKKLGAYEIGEPIGQGGMATVYKAFQPGMNRTVAVKVLPPLLAQNATFLARFRQEAQVIARLEHAHILPVYDYGESDGVVYIVMRYLDGGSLQKKIDAGRMPLREVSKVLSQIASALDYAHRQGVIHRDIKPSNVLLDRQGDAFLTDFGIAKMVAGTLDLTGSSVIGTPQYMSPEQGQGFEIDGRSDVYSLGVMLYEALAGCVPFDAETPLAVVLKHVTEPLPSARAHAPDLPESVERVLDTALAKKPGDRYATAGELAAAFDDAIRTGLNPATQPRVARQASTQPAAPLRPTAAARTPISLRRPALAGVLVEVVFFALIGLLAVVVGSLPPPDSPSGGVTFEPNILPLSNGTPTAPPLSLPPSERGEPEGGQAAAAPAACEPIVFDDFSDPGGGFPRGENNHAAWGYVGGEYQMLIKLANELEARALRQDFADYAVEVDAYLASEAPGHYGLVLGADAAVNTYTAFVVDSAQNFAVMRRDPDGARSARDWTFAPSLHTGNVVNRLRAVHKGDTLALYGNGVLLAVVGDAPGTSSSGSRIGLTAASFEKGGVDARFDNFRVCPAPESLSPTEVSLVDAFDDNRNLWGAVRYPGGLAAFIEDGQFQLSVPSLEPRQALLQWNPMFATGDFELEVDSRALEGSGGSRAGVMFGVQDLDNNYIVYASADGLLSFYKRIEGEQQAIVLDRPTEAIRTGDAVNHWKIIVAGDLLSVWLNGVQVLQASIAYTPGAIGFACEPDASRPPLARCAFDNLSVHGQPSTGDVVVSPLCNCTREVRQGQPVRVVWLWKASEGPLVDTFLSSISMSVTVDGKPLEDPGQYWGPVESIEEGAQARWSYSMPQLEPGSHIVEVGASADTELTDGRDANADGRPDTFGPGPLFTGFVQVIVEP
ncbi:MAG TPA: protein kinase [Anaerolineae bacterium]|nr:protein kinase [Anaerolineae bacterium]